MKRIFSFLIAVLVFVLNCVPVFALDEFVVENFQNMEFYYNYIENLNANIDAFEYSYYIKVFNYNDGSYPGIFFYSHYPLEIIVNTDTHDHLIEVHNSNENNFEFFICKFGNDFEWKSVESNSFIYYDTQYTFVDSQLLIQNSDCVSEKYCSPDVYVPLVSDDYEEDGVVIKGLSAFFNNMINGLKDVKDSILNLPETIINGLADLFIPDIENMKVLFNDFIDYMTAKFGFNDLIETLQGLVDSVGDEGSTVGAADVKETFSYNIGNSNFNFEFKIPFSDFYNSIVKNEIGGYMKGIFFLLLIFYNLSELYFLIRGVRPWKDPQITMIHNEIERNDINSYISHRKGGGHGV